MRATNLIPIIGEKLGGYRSHPQFDGKLLTITDHPTYTAAILENLRKQGFVIHYIGRKIVFDLEKSLENLETPQEAIQIHSYSAPPQKLKKD